MSKTVCEPASGAIVIPLRATGLPPRVRLTAEAVNVEPTIGSENATGTAPSGAVIGVAIGPTCEIEGAVVSTTNVVAAEPEAALPDASVTPVAAAVRTYVPGAVVNGARPVTVTVAEGPVAGARVRPLRGTAAPSRVRVRSAVVNVGASTAEPKVTNSESTGVFLGVVA